MEKRKTTPAAARFHRHYVVAQPSGCWLWTGTRWPNGYGSFDRELAHRFSYRLFQGDFDPRLLVCHRCDNPPCVNPDHLFLGSQSDNLKDCVDKGRWHKLTHPDYRGELAPWAKLDAGKVARIRERLANGEIQRTIALDFNVSRETIAAIKSRRKWGHV